MREKDKECLTVLHCVCFHSSTASFRPAGSVHNFWMSFPRSPHTHRTQVRIMTNSYLHTKMTPNWSSATLFFFSTVLSVSYIFNKDTVLFWPCSSSSHLISVSCLCDPLCTSVFSFTCLWCLWTPHWSYVNCKILFCICITVWKLLCFVSVCLSLAHHFSLFLWTGGEDGA